jgi:hypothetical protein
MPAVRNDAGGDYAAAMQGCHYCLLSGVHGPWGLGLCPLLFNFSDGLRTFTDAGGIELTGLAAAKAHAIAQVRDLKGR